jgi:cation-transporting ATPase 13A3/4/5
LYALIQFFSVALLYCVGANLTDNQFLYIDMVVLVPLTILSARMGPYPTLTKHLPTETLFHFPVILSVITAALIQLSFQVFFFMHIRKVDWYSPPWNAGGEAVDEDNWLSYEDIALFQISNFQYMATCCAFLVAYPFREPFYKNIWFLVTLTISFVLNVLFIALPASNPWCALFDKLDYPDEGQFTTKIVIGIVLNTLITFTAEKFIAGKFTYWYEQRQQLKVNDKFNANMQRQ